MADNVSGSYANLGGVEIVNDARTISYLNGGLKPSSMSVAADCGCPDLIELIGCDLAYVDPAVDEAPWYSADHPESADYAGFFLTEFEGMSSTFTRGITESAGDGGILGRGRSNSRTMTWRGFLLGANCCAVAYGLRWLTKVLQGSSNCNDCAGEDLELLVCCPSAESTDIEAFRTLKNVALLEGPVIISERRTAGGCEGVSGGCGGSVVMEIEFSLVAAQPWFYKAEIPIANCLPLADMVPIVSDATTPCPPADCGAIFGAEVATSFGCDSAGLPPAGTYIPCVTIPPPTAALYITVPRSAWDDFEEAVPYIVIQTNELYVTKIKLGFYSSASGNPCGDLLTNPPLCDAICDELTIISIPAHSKFIIDGRTRKMSILCDNNVAFPGEPYTLGPFSWPVFDCYGFCLEIAAAPSDGTSFAFIPTGCASVSMFPRSL